MLTVMDGNTMPTLVSNEYIPLTPAMRIIFEVNSLANSSPAMVSRHADILFVNLKDIGWRPFTETWMHGIGDERLMVKSRPLLAAAAATMYRREEGLVLSTVMSTAAFVWLLVGRRILITIL